APTARQLPLQLGDLRDVRLEVGPDAEVLPDAGHDGDVGIVVLTEAVPGRAQLEEVLHVHGVARFGAVDGDGDDVVVTRGVVDRHGLRCSLWLIGRVLMVSRGSARRGGQSSWPRRV